MNYVQPIRDRYKIFEIESNLNEQDEKYRMMFQIGIYSGLRISDILELRVEDVRDKEHITLREKKTRKEQRIKIKKGLKKLLKAYCAGKPDYEYLILSTHGENKPVTRGMAYKVIRAAGEKAGIKNLGTHTMRKTFGCHYYKKTGDIVTLQKLFNHSTAMITLRYIGIDQDRMDTALDDFEY